MPTFIYRAKDKKGTPEKGTLEAPDKYRALETLQSRGLIVTSIKEAEELIRERKRKKRFRLRLKLDDLASMARQLATLLDAGVPLLRSLDIVRQQAEVKSLYTALEEIQKDVEGGESLSRALARHPKIFSDFWVNLVATGEASGQLPYALIQLTEYMESAASLQRKIFSALIYPILLTIAATAALIVFITIVVPMFAQLYSYFGARLPFLTTVVINTSMGVKKYLFLLIFIIILTVFGILRFRHTERGRMIFDTLKVRAPLLKLLFYNVTLYRFSSGLAMLLKSGVPILYSLEVVSKAVANKIYENIILQAKEKVKVGESLGATLEGFSVEFPPFVTNMIKVGEESGNMPAMLEHVAGYYQEKVETIVARLPYIIEPIILLTIGGVIAIIVIGMFLPIFGIATAVQM
jgi:type IV pilus assembly protein PilC